MRARTALVTGAAGFLGSYVADELLREGWHVIGLDDYSAGVDNVPAGVEMVEGDLAAPRHWSEGPEPGWLSAVDAVVHCAARADIRYNDRPEERARIWRSNIEGTHRLVELTPKGATFAFVSSGAVYGDAWRDDRGRAVAATVNQPTRPGSLYAASKVAGEALVQAAGFTRHHVIRCPSMVGPRYHHGHIVDFVAKAKAWGRVAGLDRGTQKKTYRDVRAVASIICQLIRDSGDSVVNVGGTPWSVRDTVRVMGVPADWGAAERGWLGDPLDIQLDGIGCNINEPPIAWSVADTLMSLGWSDVTVPVEVTR